MASQTQYRKNKEFLISIARILFSTSYCRCHYCGRRVNFDSVTADHKEPKIRGGGDNIENLTLSCKKCNEEKANLPYEIYMKRIKF